MRGVILAGGTGTRLYPLTRAVNKHLLPVGDRPMLLHSVDKLRGAGITEICIVTGPDDIGDMARLLGSGAEYDCSFTYRIQDQAGGIAEALGLARHFVDGEKFCVLLGDNVFKDPLDEPVSAFREQKRGARVMLKRVDDPHRYGVVRFDGDRVAEILEKPDEPPSNWAVTGIYFYDGFAFEIVDGLEPSDRGELEITDVNNAYVEAGTMSFGKFEGWWTDAGTLESLRHANQLVSADGSVGG